MGLLVYIGLLTRNCDHDCGISNRESSSTHPVERIRRSLSRILSFRLDLYNFAIDRER